jgi:hypothetical protein
MRCARQLNFDSIDNEQSPAVVADINALVIRREPRPFFRSHPPPVTPLVLPDQDAFTARCTPAQRSAVTTILQIHTERRTYEYMPCYVMQGTWSHSSTMEVSQVQAVRICAWFRQSSLPSAQWKLTRVRALPRNIHRPTADQMVYRLSFVTSSHAYAHKPSTKLTTEAVSDRRFGQQMLRLNVPHGLFVTKDQGKHLHRFVLTDIGWQFAMSQLVL